MKITAIILFLSFFCGGEERWDIKTLTDNSASEVNYFPLEASVEDLTNIPLPEVKIGRHTPRQEEEKQVYQVKAIVKDYFKEADGDIHVILQDPEQPEITMIAEMPDCSCAAIQSSEHLEEIKRARAAFQAMHKADIVGHTFIFTGVTFFDIKHSKPQRGVAPNGIELHPVLNFCK